MQKLKIIKKMRHVTGASMHIMQHVCMVLLLQQQQLAGAWQ
jgi:hypothetical protein